MQNVQCCGLILENHLAEFRIAYQFHITLTFFLPYKNRNTVLFFPILNSEILYAF